MNNSPHNGAYSGNASRKLSSNMSSQQLAIPEKESKVQVAISESSQVAQQAPTLAQIYELQAKLAKYPQVEMPAEHDFAPGIYIRTLRIPKGTVIVGEVHAKEHIFILTEGEMILYTEDGQQRVKAPFQVVCRAGLKRVGYSLTNVVGSNIHLTNLTDLVAIRTEFIVATALEDK